MSSSKRWKFKDIFTAKVGCGCGPKATEVAEPKPKSKTSSSDQKPSHPPSSSPSSWDIHGGGQSTNDGDENYTSTTFSHNIDISPQHCPENHDNGANCSETVSHCPKIRDSFAMVKDSKDPYQDFRQSMLQMILEREIYSRDDLQQLLQCFLQLNSPHHHETIVRAFMEIWNGGGLGGAEEDSRRVLPLESRENEM